jgi:hypothetical protein
MTARTFLKGLLLVSVGSGVALAGCDAPTASSGSSIANQQSSPWRTIVNPDGTVVFFRYLVLYERTDTSKFQSACEDTAYEVIIPPDAHDPLTLTLSGVYAPAEDSIRRDYFGNPPNYLHLPGDTVLVPAHHTLIRFEYHELWEGTVDVEFWVPDGEGDHVLVDERSFGLLWHPRFRRDPVPAWCHNQGGGGGP